MSKREMQLLRKRLENKVQELTGLRRNNRELIYERSPDEADDAQAEAVLQLAVFAMNTGWQLRNSIEAALARMDSGEYGICESCGEPISPKRLNLVPWAVRCVPCQVLEENDADYLEVA